MYKPTESEIERRNRIRLTVAAYAYEFMADQTMSDAEYDVLSRAIRPSMSTGHEVLDRFFAEEFTPDSGMWIFRHPELDKVASLYVYFNKLKKEITT